MRQAITQAIDKQGILDLNNGIGTISVLWLFVPRFVASPISAALGSG